MYEATIVPGPSERAALGIFSASRILYISYCSNGLLLFNERTSYFFDREALWHYSAPQPTTFVVAGAVLAKAPAPAQRPHDQEPQGLIPPLGATLSIRAAMLDDGSYCVEFTTSGPAQRARADGVTHVQRHAADNLLHATPRDHPPMTDSLYRAIYGIAEARTYGTRLQEAPFSNRGCTASTTSPCISLEARVEDGRYSLCATALGIRGPEVPGVPGESTVSGRIDTQALTRFLQISDTVMLGYIHPAGDHPPLWYARSGRAVAIL